MTNCVSVAIVIYMSTQVLVEALYWDRSYANYEMDEDLVGGKVAELVVDRLLRRVSVYIPMVGGPWPDGQVRYNYGSPIAVYSHAMIKELRFSGVKDES